MTDCSTPDSKDSHMQMRQKFFPGDAYRDADGIQKIVRDGLCHRCGACVGFCPVNTFDVDLQGYPKPVRDCIHCNICVRVCSGLEVDYKGIGDQYYPPGVYQFGSLTGPMVSTYVGHANDPDIRAAGASGGVVTQMLAHWLDTGRIRGAVVTTEDRRAPHLGMGVIARTREQCIACAQSRYTTAPSLAALQEIQNEAGPFALVGLPCQMHALRKRQLMDPRWRDRIPLTIGLLCHYNLPGEATQLAGQTLAPKGARHVHTFYRQRDARGWPDNSLELHFSDGSKWRSPVGPKSTFNIVSRISALGRCMMCMDATAEFSDFSVGDPWIRDTQGNWKYHQPGGWSVIVVHTAAGEQALREAEAAGRLTLKAIPPHEVREGQHAMMREKKYRVSFRLKVRRLLGWPIPRYSVPMAQYNLDDVIKEIRFWFTRIIPAWTPLSRFFLRLGFSKFGLYLVENRERQRKRKAARRPGSVSDSDFGAAAERRPDTKD